MSGSRWFSHCELRWCDCRLCRRGVWTRNRASLGLRRRLRWGIRIVGHFPFWLLLFGFRSYSRNITCSSRCLDRKYVFVILAGWGSSKPLGAPDEPVSSVFSDVELYGFFQCIFRAVVGAKVAEAASSVEVLRIPSLPPWYDRYAFLWADPGAYSTSGASIQMEQMPSPVAFLDYKSLFWKS